MGATTPISALPYPVGTDRVMDGDNAIQALAEKLDPIANVSSVLTTVNSNASGTVRAYRRGFLVAVNVYMTVNIAIANGNLLFILPAGYRPAANDGVQWFGNLVNAVNDSNIRVHIDPASGNVNTQKALVAGDLVRGTLIFAITSLT